MLALALASPQTRHANKPVGQIDRRFVYLEHQDEKWHVVGRQKKKKRKRHDILSQLRELLLAPFPRVGRLRAASILVGLRISFDTQSELLA